MYLTIGFYVATFCWLRILTTKAGIATTRANPGIMLAGFFVSILIWPISLAVECYSIYSYITKPAVRQILAQDKPLF